MPASVVRFDFEFGVQPAGTVYVDLFDVSAPITVTNFLNYIEDGLGNRRYESAFIPYCGAGFAVRAGGFAYDPAVGD